MFKVGDKLFCIKGFSTTQYNNGKETKLIPGHIYTVRAFNENGHLLLDEVRFVDNGGKYESGYGNDNEFFELLDYIIAEE